MRKNKKQSKIKNFESKKQDKIRKIEEKWKIIKDNKLTLWLLLFPPYAIYKAYKLKLFNKLTSVFIILFLALIIVVGVDTVVNPNRVIDNKVIKTIEDMKDYGDVRRVTLIGAIESEFIIYNVITTKGEYDTYFKVVDNRNFELLCIKEIAPNTEDLYKTDKFNEKYNNVSAEVIRFIGEEGIIDRFGDIEEVLKTNANGQKIRTTKGTYMFNYQYGSVIEVLLVEDNNQTLEYSRNPIITIPKDMLKALKKADIEEILEVISYELTPISEEYTFVTKDYKYHKVIKKIDNSIILKSS